MARAAHMTRRGARHPSLVPEEVLRQLERGAESANHMEQIALDMGALLTHAFPSLSSFADDLRRDGLVTRMRTGGSTLWKWLGEDGIFVAAGHPSDTVRGWGAMAVGVRPNLSLEERLSFIRVFADDPHFAVREWAWLAVREHVRADLAHALALLGTWASDTSPNVRRFASEVTRPCGVWSSHIPILKAEPWRGLRVIASLRADPSRYVQTSVANWLNDASKTQPAWVVALCDEWLARSPADSTAWICNRARRTVRRAMLIGAAPSCSQR